MTKPPSPLPASALPDTLVAHAAQLSTEALPALAKARAGRPISACGWTMDTARQYLNEAAEDALLAHSETAGLEAAIERLFAGDPVNPSEGRPALHWALRAGNPLANGEAEVVRQSLEAPLAFAEAVRRGDILASDGHTFEAVVHIGIGGSDFGPRLLCDALRALRPDRLEVRFAANVDPLDLERALGGLDPARTLVIGVSKSFGTEETLYNLQRAHNWLQAALGDRAAHHLALVTANPERARTWAGGEDVHLFDMPLSVGGRFSLWSSAALVCMIALGAPAFRAFLRGGEAMDQHVQTAEAGDNLPLLLALLDFWNASLRRQPMRVCLAYAHRLRMLPTYLQQLEMESNGKSVSPNGDASQIPSAPAVWGGEGSIGQHSYHQWLHQGSQSVPSEFILALDPGAEHSGQTALIAHALAQAEVLANGRSFEEVMAEEPGLDPAIARQKVHAGGRPSTILSCKAFSPEALGSLIALYEHRTYLAGVLWGINSFDQWGVERGKTIAGELKRALSGEEQAADPVTTALMAQLDRQS